MSGDITDKFYELNSDALDKLIQANKANYVQKY